MIKYKGMKKSLAFVLLSLTTTSLVGCNQADPVDPSDDDFEVVDIEIAGDLKKKNYEYEDKWDFTGLVINGIDKNDKKLALKSTEYKLTPSVDAPKKLGSSLSLTVKYNKKKTIS